MDICLKKVARSRSESASQAKHGGGGQAGDRSHEEGQRDCGEGQDGRNGGKDERKGDFYIYLLFFINMFIKRWHVIF